MINQRKKDYRNRQFSSYPKNQTKPSVNSNSNTVRQEIEPENTNNHNQNILQGENRKGDKVKWTDTVGVIVNIVLAIFTALLFFLSQEQTKISQKGVAAAIEANKMTKASNDKAIADGIADDIRQDRSDSFNRKHNDSVLNLQKSSINAQISQLQEAQKEFTLSNSPIVGLSMVANVLKIGEPVGFKVYLSDFGKSPAFLKKVEMSFTISKENKGFYPKKNIKKISEMVMLYAQTSIPADLQTDVINSFDYNDLNDGNKSVFIRIKLYYKNMLTNKDEMSETISKISFLQKPNVQTISYKTSIK